MAIVYRHIRLDKNEPFYIGIGKTERRAFRTDSRNDYWKNIVSKTSYEVEILFDDISWEEACKKEIEFIKLYGRKDNGTGILANMTDGGDGIDYTPEVRRKISEKLSINNGACRKEVKLKISNTLKEYFKKHKKIVSLETRQKLSDINKDRIISEETKKLMSESKKGKPSVRKGVKLTVETKEKLRMANLGKKQSPETIAKRVEAIRLKKQIKLN